MSWLSTGWNVLAQTPIASAVFNRAAQELVLANDAGIKWSFKIIFINDRLRIGQGRGYMQEMRGEFDENGTPHVFDRLDQNASDFEIWCGALAESIQRKEDDYTFSNGKTKTSHQTVVHELKSSRF